jgi:hypothetical protein
VREVLRERPGHPPAVAVLEELLRSAGAVRVEAAALLEPLLAAAGDEERLVEVLVVRAAAETGLEARAGAWRRIADLYGGPLGSPQLAFAAAAAPARECDNPGASAACRRRGRGPPGLSPDRGVAHGGLRPLHAALYRSSPTCASGGRRDARFEVPGAALREPRTTPRSTPAEAAAEAWRASRARRLLSRCPQAGDPRLRRCRLLGRLDEKARGRRAAVVHLPGLARARLGREVRPRREAARELERGRTCRV